MADAQEVGITFRLTAVGSRVTWRPFLGVDVGHRGFRRDLGLGGLGGSGRHVSQGAGGTDP